MIFHADFLRSTEDCGFSNSENMARLRKCLRGEALAYVYSMLIFPDNVPQIIRDLEARFGQLEQIIPAMMDKAKKVSAVRQGSLESLVTFRSAVRNFTATVKTLKRSDHLSKPQPQYELVAKLSEQLRMN